MSRTSTSQNAYTNLTFLNEDDPVKLLSSNNYLDQLVPIIKNSLKSDSIDELIHKLKTEDEKKDNEITAVLNVNEEKIASSAYSVSKVSREASGISEQLLDINDHLSKTSSLTIEKKFNLLKLKKNISKIEESDILINKVLHVLELTDKTQDLIQNNKFFNALKNLNDLTKLSKDFDRDIPFLNHINNSIPYLKNSIRDESLSLMKRNLNAIDGKLENLTNTYYDEYTKLLEQWESFKAQNKDFEQYKLNSSVERSLRPSYSSIVLPPVEDFIDLGFVYDTFSVFQNLNQVDFFKDEFNKELLIRRDKSLLPFQINDSKNLNFQALIKDEENLKSFLSKVIGFLITYCLISEKFPQLVRQQTNDVWENLSSKIYQYLKNLVLNEILDINRIIELKKIFGNFFLILENFNLSHDHFYNLLIVAFKKYSQISQFKFSQEFSKLGEEDDLMSMVVYDKALYKKITTVSWYKGLKPIDEIKFPEVLPFSSIYPMACAQTRTFISHQQKFLKEYYRFDTNSLNKLIVENVDKTLINSINKYYNDKLDFITREELSQNMINLEYFLIMTKEVANLLSNTFESHITLSATEAINKTRKATENRLFELVDGKIDDLVDFIDWDWTSKAKNTEPNYFIKDIGDFLKNMFNSTFSNLPISIKNLLLYRVFDLLAQRFLEDLNSQRSLSETAIANFDLDISYIEQITKELSPSKEVTSNRDSLLSMFLQLRQTINLLKIGDLEEYKDDAIRNRKYDHIKPEYAISLFTKLENHDNSGQSTPEQVTPQNTSAASKYFMKFRQNKS